MWLFNLNVQELEHSVNLKALSNSSANDYMFEVLHEIGMGDMYSCPWLLF